MNIAQVVNVVDIAIHKLPNMESLYKQLKHEVDKLQYIRQGLLNDIAGLERKISILDKTAFSYKQECRRKHQEIQELTAQKDILEKWITDILNNDELKEIVKESVKALLSENKQVISVSFAALIQTLKADPEMIKVIYTASTANNGEQDKDNNITKHLEANKNSLLDLAEKNYQNFIKALTNNVMNTAANSSYNPTLSLPQSLSTFPNLSTQSNTYRTEDLESFRNGKGDITD